MWFGSKYKKTDYTAGFLKFEDVSQKLQLGAPANFVAPRKLDFRDMCIQTSDQKNTPHCAGYATAGFIEILNWKKNHYPQQIDGNAIYNKAKQIDGDATPGTTLSASTKAAIDLGLIKGAAQYIGKNRDQVKFAVHSYDSCIAGFMITNEWNMVNKNGTVSVLTNPVDIGGHAVLICGYDPDYVYIQNSWGIEWGFYGFCQLSWNQFDKQFMSGAVIA